MLKDWGLTEHKDLFIFDYDWRQSNLDNAKGLEKFISDTFKNGEKFNIVAHSMGGLVTRLYLENTKDHLRVNKVIYLGTPFLGSANTLGTLSEGWGTIENWVAGGMNTIRHVALSFPSMLELLPRYSDCCSLKIGEGTYRPVDIFDPNQWKSNDWLPPDMKSGPSFAKFSANLSRARSISAVLATPMPGVIEVKFAGNPMDTRFIFAVQQGHTQPSSDNWKFSFERGDGTVPVWSAARDITLKDLAGSLPSFSAHATIFDDKWVLDELKRELFSIQAIVDRPIAGLGAPTVHVLVEGRQEDWPLDRVDITPVATYLRKSDEIVANVQLKFDGSARNFRGGAYRPRIVLLQDTRTVEMALTETSSLQQLANNTLAFQARIAASDLEEGAAGISVELPDTGNSLRLGVYVVVMQ